MSELTSHRRIFGLRHLSPIQSHEVLCEHVMNLNISDRCDFIRSHSSCHVNVHHIDYLDFIFCTIGYGSTYAYLGGFFVVCLICTYLFIALGTTSDKFFSPALAVISKLLGLSENLAGVTLLAFGNGSPDLFTSLLNTSGDTELMYTQLIGGAVFVTGFILGTIMIIRPFRINWKTYIRDVLFFACAVIYIHNSIHDQIYEIHEGFVTIGIYIGYLFVVIGEHFVVKKKIRDLRDASVTSSISSVADIMKRVEELESVAEIQIRNRKNSSMIFDTKVLNSLRCHLGEHPNKGLFKKFFQSINPIDPTSWHESNIFIKVFMIIRVPLILALNLMIPMVDFTEDMHGWSKLLNMLNVIILPQILLLAINKITYMIGGQFPLAVLVLIISLGIGVAIFLTSRNDCPPKYHVAFAIGSISGSILVIYNAAKEVVSVMTTVGIISSLSDSMVGLSILAWGNSIGDMFANIALAKHGYQQMAFAACFGGPMFNTLLGIGSTFILKGINSENNLAHTREGAMGPNCILFLVIIMMFTLFALLCTDFICRKSVGYFLLSMYSIFIFYCLLGEFEVMHPYGTDHSMTGKCV